ncbi:hypothetical protein HAX54_033047, partial [Datura stramonium]|nr:hypothetical protein [Datura stramonium]
MGHYIRYQLKIHLSPNGPTMWARVSSYSMLTLTPIIVPLLLDDIMVLMIFASRSLRNLSTSSPLLARSWWLDPTRPRSFEFPGSALCLFLVATSTP